MAKKDKFENEDIKLSPIVETNEDNASVVDEVQVTSVKKVKIHTVEEIDCIVACVPYRFAKDKDVQVPSDVAAIICFAKKAYRI